MSTPRPTEADMEALAERADWPKPGLLGRVKCSDTQWRTAFCIDGARGPEWVFADGARRRVDTSTAMSLVADTELAAAEAKVRADERERIAQAIEADALAPKGVLHQQWAEHFSELVRRRSDA